MGAGSSSVQDINIKQKDESDISSKKKTLQLRKSASEGAPEVGLGDCKSGAQQVDNGNNNEVETLTKQLCESESLRLDLEDRVQCLEQELERVNSETLAQAEQPCDETLHAKDQYIAKLEREKKEVETECHKLKVRHRKKVKQFNTQMAEYKQETNFQMMELKEEMERLKIHNSGKSRTVPERDRSNNSETQDTAKLPGGDKMALILELSAQVTEQQDAISKLESTLSEKDETISDLRAKLKNNAEYLKAINDTQLASKSDISASKSSSKNSLLNKPSGYGGKKKSSRRKNNDCSDLDTFFGHSGGLFESDEDESMQTLNTLLKGVKATDSKTRLSTDSLDDETYVLPVRQNSQLHAAEESDSGNGRDSGLGSAGQREVGNRKSLASGSVSQTVLPDWKESGSGLSDSDFERDYGIGGKVASAPPKLQNGASGGRKMKKKSNSLRKRSEASHNRPPKPGMAFMNPVAEETNIINVQSYAPMSNISPMQVT